MNPLWVGEGREASGRPGGEAEKRAGGQRGEGGMELSQLGPWMLGAQTEAGAGVSGPRRTGYQAGGRAAPASAGACFVILPGPASSSACCGGRVPGRLAGSPLAQGSRKPKVPRAPGGLAPGVWTGSQN